MNCCETRSVALSVWLTFLLAASALAGSAVCHEANPEVPALPLVESGRSLATIVLGRDAGPLANTAARLLQSRIEQKSGAQIPIRETEDSGADASHIIIATPESGLLGVLAGKRQNPSPNDLGDEGFCIERINRNIYLIAQEGRGMIYAVGSLLHTASYSGGSVLANPPLGIDKPFMHDRFLHLTPHYHTFFEVADAKAITPIIEDLALWGLNGLSMEIEEAEYSDPFSTKPTSDDGQRVWEKAKALWTVGMKLGLKLGLVDSANDPYKDQVTDEILAQGGLRYLDKPLANPMIPSARAMLLRNKVNMYRDLKRSGLHLDNVLWFPYDTGGCFSKACQPWILKFLELTEQLGTDLKKYNPSARVFVTDWLSSDAEGEMMVDYLNKHHATKIDGVWKQDRTAADRFDLLDKRFGLLIFLDLSVGGFGTIGAQPLPAMIHSFISEGDKRGASGVMIYTEGIWDDFNKALSLQMAWKRNLPAEEFSREYASYYFDSNMAPAFFDIVQRSERSWPDARMPLEALSRFVFIDSPESAELLEELTLAAGQHLRPDIRSSWRWQVIEYRARIGKVAALLQSPGDYRAIVFQAINAGAPNDQLRRDVEIKRKLLEQYRALVDQLRTTVYREPSDRIFSMNVDGDFMSQVTSVRVGEWKKVLDELDKKLDVPRS